MASGIKFGEKDNLLFPFFLKGWRLCLPGLVEGVGGLVRVLPKGPDAELVVRPPWPVKEAVLGESVAVNGACLTVTRAEGENAFLRRQPGDAFPHDPGRA